MYASTTAFKIGAPPHVAAATKGKDLYYQSGAPKAGETNISGGDTYIRGGDSTGTGVSNIFFGVAIAGASGTTARTVTDVWQIHSSGSILPVTTEDYDIGYAANEVNNTYS